MKSQQKIKASLQALYDFHTNQEDCFNRALTLSEKNRIILTDEDEELNKDFDTPFAKFIYKEAVDQDETKKVSAKDRIKGVLKA